MLVTELVLVPVMELVLVPVMELVLVLVLAGDQTLITETHIMEMDIEYDFCFSILFTFHCFLCALR